jgi:glycosyltransferase involved in cell wall biosynthesis
VLANSKYTAVRFDSAGSRVVYPAIDLERFDPDRISHVPSEGAVLGLVAQLTPWKAQDDAIRALALLRAEHRDATLVLVGATTFDHPATRFDNVEFEQGLHRLAQELGVSDHVMFAGERADVPELLASFDLLLCPSWEEPFGRSVVEAMAMGVPVLATSVGGPAEIVSDGVEGRLLPPKAPDRWARAAAELLDDPEKRRALGAAGRERAAAFSRERQVAETLAAYSSVAP